MAAKMLRNWNGSHATNDTTPTIYYRLLSNIFQMAMLDELGETDYNIFVNTHIMKNSYERFLSDDKSGWWDNIHTKNALETRKLIFVAAFRSTIAGLQQSSGEITNWAWGGAHTLEHVHPIGRKKPLDKIFNVGPSAIRGGIETINNTGFPLNTAGKYEVTYGPSMRILMDMKDLDNAIGVLATGQSGHLRSPHYFDQHRLHVNCFFRPMMMNKDEIEEQCTNVITFKPQ
jgi:penicillin amidase